MYNQKEDWQKGFDKGVEIGHLIGYTEKSFAQIYSDLTALSEDFIEESETRKKLEKIRENLSSAIDQLSEVV